MFGQPPVQESTICATAFVLRVRRESCKRRVYNMDDDGSNFKRRPKAESLVDPKGVYDV
jgi:hypothetical protein